jgi:hypothetical protein
MAVALLDSYLCDWPTRPKLGATVTSLIRTSFVLRYFAVQEHRDPINPNPLEFGELPIPREDFYFRDPDGNTSAYIKEARIAIAGVSEYETYPCFSIFILRDGNRLHQTLQDTGLKGNSGHELCGMLAYLKSLDEATVISCYHWGKVLDRVDVQLNVTVSSMS